MFDRLEENGEEQLHLENYMTYEHRMCTAVLVRSCTFPQHGPKAVLVVSILKTWQNPLSDQGGRDLVKIPMAHPSAHGAASYSNHFTE